MMITAAATTQPAMTNQGRRATKLPNAANMIRGYDRGGRSGGNPTESVGCRDLRAGGAPDPRCRRDPSAVPGAVVEVELSQLGLVTWPQLEQGSTVVDAW